MSDARDKVAEAHVKTKQLAARLLRRKDELQAELARRNSQRAGLSALGESTEAAALARDLDSSIKSLTTELATVTADLQAAQRELGELKKLAGQASVADAKAAVRAATEHDPLIRTATEEALDNVREYAAQVEAELRLDKELESPAEPTAPMEPPIPSGPVKKTL